MFRQFEALMQKDVKTWRRHSISPINGNYRDNLGSFFKEENSDSSFLYVNGLISLVSAHREATFNFTNPNDIKNISL